LPGTGLRRAGRRTGDRRPLLARQAHQRLAGGDLVALLGHDLGDAEAVHVERHERFAAGHEGSGNADRGGEARLGGARHDHDGARGLGFLGGAQRRPGAPRHESEHQGCACGRQHGHVRAFHADDLARDGAVDGAGNK
jgi:hypothetical protein